jgi:hypothetical protein
MICPKIFADHYLKQKTTNNEAYPCPFIPCLSTEEIPYQNEPLTKKERANTEANLLFHIQSASNIRVIVFSIINRQINLHFGAFRFHSNLKKIENHHSISPFSPHKTTRKSQQ